MEGPGAGRGLFPRHRTTVPPESYGILYGLLCRCRSAPNHALLPTTSVFRTSALDTSERAVSRRARLCQKAPTCDMLPDQERGAQRGSASRTLPLPVAEGHADAPAVLPACRTRYRMTPAGLEPATSGLGMPGGPLTAGHDSDNSAQIGAFPAPPESRFSVWFRSLSQRRVKEKGGGREPDHRTFPLAAFKWEHGTCYPVCRHKAARRKGFQPLFDSSLTLGAAA